MAIGNSVNDEIREQHKKVLKEEGWKGRLKYFTHYYKWPVLIGLFVTLLLGSSLYQVLSQKDTALQVLMVNGFPNVDANDIMTDFESTITMDPEKEDTLIDDTFYIDPNSHTIYDEQNAERLFVMSSAGVVDVVLVDETYFEIMAEAGYLLNLSKVLTDEQMELYKDRAFYYDSPNNYAQGDELVGIEITASPKILETQSYPNKKAYFCMIMNAPNIENGLAFLEYLDTP